MVDLADLIAAIREADPPLLTSDQWVLFAADCAEWVLPLYEARYPDDDRPRKAIEAARRSDAVDAARAAARDAADAAYAARDAADAAYAARDAAYAARDAAYAAARDAADAAYAARDAADAAYAARDAAYAARAAGYEDFPSRIGARLLWYVLGEQDDDRAWSLWCAVQLGADIVTVCHNEKLKETIR